MGKGCAWRKGTNRKAYDEADYWKERDKRIAAAKKLAEQNENVSGQDTITYPTTEQ